MQQDRVLFVVASCDIRADEKSLRHRSSDNRDRSRKLSCDDRWHGESNDIGQTKVDAVFIAESDSFIVDRNVITPPSHTVGVATAICGDNFLLESNETAWNTVIKAALEARRGTAVPV